jgi:hypothetical protein
VPRGFHPSGTPHRAFAGKLEILDCFMFVIGAVVMIGKLNCSIARPISEGGLLAVGYARVEQGAQTRGNPIVQNL